MGKKLFIAVFALMLASGLGLFGMRISHLVAMPTFPWIGAPDAAIEGAQLYAANCANCHGENGNRLPVVPLYSWDYLDQLGDPYLVNAVAQGKNDMQPFAKEQGGILNADQIESIVRYLRAPGGPASTISPRPAKNGHDLYVDNCSSCHGLTGAKLSQAQIGSDGYVNSRGESSLTRIIGTGQGKMPGFASTLQSDQTKSIIAYLRTLAPTAQKPTEPLPGGSPVQSMAIPHPVADRVDGCLVCHGATGIVPVPRDHTARSNTACLACHRGEATVQSTSAQAQPSADVPRVPHELKGRDDCLACHSDKGILPVPQSHAGRAKESCMGCHKPIDVTLVGSIPRTPHETDTRQDCLGCHKTGFMATIPADHADKKPDQCQSCHKLASSGPSKPVPQITHDTAGAGDCLRCHGPKQAPVAAGRPASVPTRTAGNPDQPAPR